MTQKKLLLRSLWLLLCISIILSSYLSPVFGFKTLAPGMILPQFKLDATEAEETKQYLGLKNLKSFTLSQIPAKLILIEVFSLYCPICHKQAPIANTIYNFIQNNPKLRKDIKMIGIGAGNNLKEIKAYKTQFRVSFPLFSDPDFSIHKKMGEPRTPFTILVNRNGKILFTHFGVVEDVDAFIRKIREINEQQNR